MNDVQRKALAAIAGDDLVNMVIATGEEHTKELEETVAFKEAEEEVAPEAKSEETTEVPDEGTKDATTEDVPEAEVASESKDLDALAQQIVAGLNLDGFTQALSTMQEGMKALLDSQKAQEDRLKALEDIGGSETAPLVPLPVSAYWQASRVAQTESKEKAVAKPVMPDAISEMAKRIPV